MFKVLEVAPGAVLRWVAGANGQAPGGAVATGFEAGSPLYACRAPYVGGTHPGKLVGSTCNIGWGGSEVPLSSYDVLCQPESCAALGASCGQIDDGCGSQISCGGCGTDACFHNQCVPAACVPTPCPPGKHWHPDDCRCELGLPS